MKQIRQLLEWSDIGRAGVLLSMVTYLVLNRHVLARQVAKVQASPDQPWIRQPADGSTVKAGIVLFEGEGASGSTVEVLENGRIVGVGQSSNGKWLVAGKLFGPGVTRVFARSIGNKAMQSPESTITVTGATKQTLFVTNPIDSDYITPGRLVLKGKGKPNDSIVLFYNGSAIEKTTVNGQGTWMKAVWISHPTERGEFRAVSKAEGEIATVYVEGPT